MITLALYNLKGGVGKTAAAVNLAYLSAAAGYKTLLWDLDPQGSVSFYFNIKSTEKNESKKILLDEIELENATQDSAFENLWIVPADLSARSADVLLSSLRQNKKKLKHILNGAKFFDVIILDCPPGISLLHENIFQAADFILMPNIPTTLSIHSYDKVIDYFKENDLDQTKLKGFFSMVDIRKNMHNETMQQFAKSRKFFKNYIPYLSDVEKMGVHMQPVFEFANSSHAALSYRDLWAEIKKACL